MKLKIHNNYLASLNKTILDADRIGAVPAFFEVSPEEMYYVIVESYDWGGPMEIHNNEINELIAKNGATPFMLNRILTDWKSRTLDVFYAGIQILPASA
jgi:hypothetical protein